MAWTTPRTWVAGEKPTAATMNLHIRDNLNELGAGSWTSYTPTIVGTASPTLNCRYLRTGGKKVTVEFNITFTAAATTTLSMSLPSTPLGGDNAPVGTCRLLDASAADIRFGHAILFGGNVLFVVQSTVTAWGSAAAAFPFAAWASGDKIIGILQYRE